MLSKSLIFRILAVSVLTTCSSVSLAASGGMFPENKKNHNQGIWQIAIETQDFGQSNNLAQLNIVSFGTKDPLPITPSNSSFYLAPDPQKNWGYLINVGYIFPKHQYDVQASYTGLNASNNDRHHSFIESGNQVTDYSKATYDFSEAEITFGDYIKRTKKLMLRVGYGVAYVNIKQKDNNFWQAEDVTDGLVFANTDQKYENKFWGIGPKFTLDGQFDLNKYFGAVGGIGAAVLFGETKESMKSTAFISTEEPLPSHHESNENRAAFGFDGKLGLRYMQDVSKRFRWNLEAGYKASIYIDALQDDEFSITGIDNNERDFVMNTLQAEENYSNYGPYINLSVDFM